MYNIVMKSAGQQELFTIRYTKRAAHDLGKLDRQVESRIVSAISTLKHNPRPRGSRKLVNFSEYRIRVGRWRVVYIIDDADKLITVAHIDPRGHDYRSVK